MTDICLPHKSPSIDDTSSKEHFHSRSTNSQDDEERINKLFRSGKGAFKKRCFQSPKKIFKYPKKTISKNRQTKAQNNMITQIIPSFKKKINQSIMAFNASQNCSSTRNIFFKKIPLYPKTRYLKFLRTKSEKIREDYNQIVDNLENTLNSMENLLLKNIQAAN